MKKSILFLLLIFFTWSGWAINYSDGTEGLQQELRKLTGSVLDESGEPMVGVNVFVRGTKAGTLTNQDGKFSLDLPAGVSELEFSYLGYDTKIVTVSGMQNNITINMKENTKLLDEVVVVGYGSARKRDLTGAVSQVKTEKLDKEAPGTVQEILRASAAGMNIGMTRDAKGDASLQIRGQRSLKASNSPLLVLDGVIFQGELSEINPSDIDQVDILKDASSAAVYGSKSASGVILITTKKGKKGKPMIRLDMNYGFVTMGANMKVYKPEGYLQWRHDLMLSTNANAKPGEFDYPSPENLAKYGITLDQWLAYRPSSGNSTSDWLARLSLTTTEISNYLADRTFDWYDYSFQTGFRQNYNASISGNREDINYYFSMGYTDNKGVVVGDSYSAYRANLKLNMDVAPWLNIGANVNFQDRSQNGQPVDWASQIINNSPYSLPTDSLGNRVHYPMGNNSGGSINSAYEISAREQRNGWTTWNNILSAKVKFPLNITYEMNFSPRFVFHYWQKWESSVLPEWKSSNNGYAERQSTKTFNWQIDNIIRWNQTFAQKHKVELTLLQNAEENKYWSEMMTGRDFSPTDVLGYHYMQGANVQKTSITSTDRHSTGDALMARLFYSYNNKYMMTATIRRDGYSLFGMENPRATFPSMALGWTFTEESFFKWKPMNFGKLRISYGENGNRDLGSDPYIALSNMTTGAGKFVYINQAGTLYQTSQLYTDRMANYMLQWESTASFNGGLDFGFLNNHINGSVDAYYMKTTNLLMDRSLPDFLGFNSVASNLGQVDNKGIEFTINTVNMKRNNFEWSSSFNFSLNRNKIVHLYYTYEDVKDDQGNVIGKKEKDDSGNGWFIGHDISEIWNFKILGIWQTDEADEAKKYGQIPGDPKILDVNGDYKYGNEDKVFQGPSSPRFRWTFRNDFNIFRNFDFSFMLYSYWGQKSRFDRPVNKNGFLDRNNSYIQGYWTPDNPTNDYARLQSNDLGTGAQFLVEKSFIRLDNVSLSYTVPKRYLKRFGISDLKIFGTGRNVAVWAPHWKFWDPESARNPYDDSGSSISGPSPQTWTLGFNITL